MYMELDYLDNPLKAERWLETLSDKERDLFNKGYLMALYGLCEQISESQRKIMSRLMTYDAKSDEGLQLRSRLLLLDIYQAHYTTRINNLTRVSAL